MTYLLAEKLRETGFPQEKKGGVFGCIHGGHNPTPDYCWDKVYIPTLEELIDACGEAFHSVGKYMKGTGAHSNETTEINPPTWLAEAGVGAPSLPTKKYDSWGHTPTEAVAHLWLELNKNRCEHAPSRLLCGICPAGVHIDENPEISPM